jgi:hypothetical protein
MGGLWCSAADLRRDFRLRITRKRASFGYTGSSDGNVGREHPPCDGAQVKTSVYGADQLVPRSRSRAIGTAGSADRCSRHNVATRLHYRAMVEVRRTAARVVFACDVEDDVRRGFGERRELGTEERRQDDRRRDEADHTRRDLAQVTEFGERRADVAECWCQPVEQALAGFRRGDRPRGSREQANAQPLLEFLHRVTDRRSAHAQPRRRAREATFLGDDRKDRERTEILPRDW